MKKCLLLYLVLITLLTGITGCWNSRELSTMSVVQAVGIDKTEDGKFSISAQIMRPGAIKGPGTQGGGGGGEKGVWAVTSTGETIFDAFRNAAMQADRKLYFAHTEAFIIGEEAAKSGIAPLIDFWDRDHEGRLLLNIFIARGQAKEVIEGEHEQENIPAKAMEGLARATVATSKVANIKLLDALKTLHSDTSDPYIPGIEVVKRKEDGKEKKQVKLSQTAVFNEDKLVGWFDGRETRGLLWVLGKVKSGIIIIKSPGEEGKKLSLEILRGSSEIKPEISEGKLIINLKVKEEGNLGEQLSQRDLVTPELFAELEKRQAEVIIAEIMAAFSKAQGLRSDLFKFGEAFHRKFPKEWPELKKNWDEEFKKLILNIEVDAKIRRPGLITTPPMGEVNE